MKCSTIPIVSPYRTVFLPEAIGCHMKSPMSLVWCCPSSCCSRVSLRPPPNNFGHCHCSWVPIRIWWEDPVAKDNTHCVTGHGEIKLVLAGKLPSLLDVSTGRSYVGYYGEKSHQQIYPTVNLPSMGPPPLKQSLCMQCQTDFREKNILCHLINNWNFLFIYLE